MVRLVFDHRLLRVRRNESPARDADSWFWLEETARMEPEEVALEVDEDHDRGSREREGLPARDHLVADVTAFTAVGRALQLGAVVNKPPEPPSH
jgi:hypothetical protein